MSSKALVIKNVDFSTNKLDTVSYGDPVPCTALSLNKSTATMSAMLSTETLVASPTPSNTTDAITWASSNENVATVSVSGIVTQIGIGSCTITATCGEYSASCTITASASYIADTDLTAFHGNGIQLQTDKDYLNTYSSTRQRAYLSSTNLLNGYKAVSVAEGYDNYFPIPLPKNAQSVTVTVSGNTQVFASVFLYLLNANQQTEDTSLATSQKGAKCYGSVGGAFSTGSTIKTIDISSINSNVNSFSVRLSALNVGDDESLITNTITISFA